MPSDDCPKCGEYHPGLVHAAQPPVTEVHVTYDQLESLRANTGTEPESDYIRGYNDALEDVKNGVNRNG